MNFTNAEIKLRGKKAFRANYWPCVVVSLIMSVIAGVGTISAGKYEYINGQVVRTPPSGLENGVHLLLGILITAVIGVGVARFYMNNRQGRAQFSDVICGFKENYTNIVFVRLIVSIKTALWTLLFIIPGIVKDYSWCLVPYLLSDDPNLDYKTAMQRSAEMMQGRKMQKFLLDLSFIGWVLMGLVTLGIGMLLWTAPYMEAADAEWYAAVAGKDQNMGYGDSSYDSYSQDEYGRSY